MDHTDTSWPHQRWEFSQHPLAHQKLSLSRMWIQDKGAAETSIPISNTRNLKPSHIVCCIEAENEVANQIKAKEAVKKDKRWNGLETDPFAEIWV